MKKTNLLFTGCLVLLLSSCSVVNNDNFYSKKYTRFNNTQRDIAAVTPGVRAANTPVAETVQPVSHETPSIQPSTTRGYPVVTMDEPNKNNSNLQEPVYVTQRNDILTVTPAEKYYFTPTEYNTPAKKQKRLSLWDKYGAAADVVAVLLAILIPPLGVWYYENGITKNFWIDIILCILFWIPGIIFALLVVLDVI